MRIDRNRRETVDELKKKGWVGVGGKEGLEAKKRARYWSNERAERWVACLKVLLYYSLLIIIFIFTIIFNSNSLSLSLSPPPLSVPLSISICLYFRCLSVQFSSVSWPIRSSRGHEGRFSRDPLPVFSAGGPREQFWHRQIRPLFDAVHPAFSLRTTLSPTQGALKDGFGEAVVARDMPEPCKFPSLDVRQKKLLWTHKEESSLLMAVVMSY